MVPIALVVARCRRFGLCLLCRAKLSMVWVMVVVELAVGVAPRQGRAVEGRQAQGDGVAASAAQPEPRT
jgi:hypothetical protein